MMIRWLMAWLLLFDAGIAAAAVRPLTKTEAANWKRWVLPLPHEISISAMADVKPSDVALKFQVNAGPAGQQAALEIRTLFQKKAGLVPEGKSFEIVMGVVDDKGRIGDVPVAGASRLKELPNRDQAYVIEHDGKARLVVAALTDKGLYYGVRTLCQLLEFNLTHEKAVIPLATVTDWPDLERRGHWHMPWPEIPWLASMKMNCFITYTGFSFNDTGDVTRVVYAVSQEGWEERPFDKARTYAAEIIPGTMHLDLMNTRGDKRFLDVFSGLLGKGDRASNQAVQAELKRTDISDARRRELGSFYHRLPCASSPKLTRFLTNYLRLMAQDGAAEVCVWQSEYPWGQCECQDCLKTGQYFAEVQRSVEAWQAVRQDFPDLKLHVFFGSGALYGLVPPESEQRPTPGRFSDQDMEHIAAWLPRDVWWDVSGGVKEDILEKYAAAGGRVLRYQMTRPAIITRWTCGEKFRKQLANAFDRKFRGLLQTIPGAYIAGVRSLFDYSESVVAEFSWNANGRTVREFSEAWAMRAGYNRPDLFGEWIAVMTERKSRVVWKLEACANWNGVRGVAEENRWLARLPRNIRERKMDNALALLLPDDSSTDDAEWCRKALALAQQLEPKDPLRETEELLRYCEMETQAYRLLDRVVKGDPENAADRKAVQESLDRYRTSVQAFVAAMNTKIDGLNLEKTLAESLKKGEVTIAAALNETVKALAPYGAR